jgi:hypothetical protein
MFPLIATSYFAFYSVAPHMRHLFLSKLHLFSSEPFVFSPTFQKREYYNIKNYNFFSADSYGYITCLTLREE